MYFVIKGLSLLFFIIALKLYKPPKSKGSEDTAMEPTSNAKTIDDGDKPNYASTDNGKPLPEDTVDHGNGLDNPNFDES